MNRCSGPHLAVLALVAAIAAPAHAKLIAGWDFSQYAGDNSNSIDDGVTYTNILAANYSNLVPPGPPAFGTGQDAATFGRLYYDGQFGSTNVNPNPNAGAVDFAPTVAPNTGSLVSNLEAPTTALGFASFDNQAALQANGQLSFNLLAMTAFSPLSVVFRADLTSVPENGTGWFVSFAGRTFEGSQTLTIEASFDGAGYASAGTINLDAVDKPYTVNLGSVTADTVAVRFNFQNPQPPGILPIIDNVAINTPEPGGAALALAATVALLCTRYARR